MSSDDYFFIHDGENADISDQIRSIIDRISMQSELSKHEMMNAIDGIDATTGRAFAAILTVIHAAGENATSIAGFYRGVFSALLWKNHGIDPWTGEAPPHHASDQA